MQRELRDGLILRSLDDGTEQDRERLPVFYRDTFLETGDQDALTFIDWTNELIDQNPLTSLEDFFYVVDPAADDKIVSATLLIPQTWRYEDIEIPVGRPELVATDKDYRRRGLVRELFKDVHKRSEAQGHLLQAITGIEHYYRQFGYAMAVDLGRSGFIPFQAIPPLKDDQKPEFTLRKATEDDIPTLVRIDAAYGKRGILSAVRDETMWQFELTGRTPSTPMAMDTLMIENTDGIAVGYLFIASIDPESHNYARCYAYVLDDTTSYLATIQDVVRGVAEYAHAISPKPYTLNFSDNISDELREVLRNVRNAKLDPHTYAWYLRVPDRVTFFKRITPILEERLVGSAANAYTGKLTIGFYDFNTLVFDFENGKITNISEAPTDEVARIDTKFPYDMFWTLVFGYRTLDELLHILPDISYNFKATILLNALFPKKSHALMPIA